MTILKGSAASSTGAAAILLGDMAPLSIEGWVFLSVIVALSIGAGALARQGQYESKPGQTVEQVMKERRLAFTVILAQFLFGMVVAAQAAGNIWITIPACLVIGWTGNTFLKWLAARSGIGKDGD